MTSGAVKTVVIFGAGTMGEGIAQVFAEHGMEVRLVDIQQDILDRCQRHINANLELFNEYELIHESPSIIASRISAVQNTDEALIDCDFVVETISEVLEAKKQLLLRLDGLPDNVIIASNTSSIPITQMTREMKTSHRVIGVHYFNPAHIMPLVEIHRGENTDEHVLKETYRLMLALGKKPVLVKKEIPGFIVNRITGAMMREIYYLLEEGVVSPEDLDTAMKASTGFKLSLLGPMALEDMAGLDVASKVHARTFRTLDNRTAPPSLLFEKVDKKELGIKSGRGWLDYAGKTREEIIDKTNRMLLQQLALFKSRDHAAPACKPE